MTIHYYTFSEATGGSSRQRAFRVADELRKKGLHIVIHEPPVLSISRTRWPKKGILIFKVIRSLFSIRKGDIVYLQRAIANKYFFAILTYYIILMRPKVIFDFDDPVYLHSYFKTKTFAQLADIVVTCTHGQAEWAKQFNKNIEIIHIAVDFPPYARFTKNYDAPTAKVVIGWVGTGPEHVRNLEILARVFTKLLAKNPPPFEFVLVGALKAKNVYVLFENIPGLSVRFIDALDWKNPEAVPKVIQTFDIGVLPHQSDGEWNKSKTSLKILEYMACGVASIASSFGEMPYVLEDGVNGFVAATEDEWVEKLEKLTSDKALRARFGKAGQERVQKEYSFDAIIPRLMNIFQKLDEK
jgi:glycosyltransferase involved in cell wall biosynthesis